MKPVVQIFPYPKAASTRATATTQQDPATRPQVPYIEAAQPSRRARSAWAGPPSMMPSRTTASSKPSE